MSSHPPQILQSQVEPLNPALPACAGDNFHKVTAEALNTLQILIKIVDLMVVFDLIVTIFSNSRELFIKFMLDHKSLRSNLCGPP